MHFSAEFVICTNRGILPAVSGQFVSHGLRTFAYEGSLNVMKALTGGAAELQVGLPCSFCHLGRMLGDVQEHRAGGLQTEM